MLPPRIRDQVGLEAALAASDFLLFKHSTRCPVSAAAFREYELWFAAHPKAATGWIDVIKDRSLARLVAERTGLQHESPQALQLENGRVAWNASHQAITRASLERARG